MVPEMVKKGYPRDFATALTVSGSIQATLIPPSHNAVIYSMAAGGSISGFRVDGESGALAAVWTQSGLPAGAGLQGIAARDF